MKKLSPTQHAEMNRAYKAFLANSSIRISSRATGKALNTKRMIVTVPVGNGFQHTGLTKTGLEYCRKFFPMFVVV